MLKNPDEVLELNVMRSHNVAVIWEKCIKGKLPILDPCKCGWELDNDWIKLRPCMLLEQVKIVPEEVLKMTDSL